MDCNAGPTLSRNLVGRPTFSVPGTSYASAMVVEGIHIEDIFELASLVLSLNISWTFSILAHEENQYTDFLCIALQQTKAGPWSSGTPFLVFYWANVMLYYYTIRILIMTTDSSERDSVVSHLQTLYSLCRLCFVLIMEDFTQYYCGF